MVKTSPNNVNWMKSITSKNKTTKVPVIGLAIVLLAGLFFNALPPSLQAVEAQAQNSNDNSITTIQLISQISTQVAKENPGINADNLKQLLTSLATQTSQTSNQAESTKDVRLINLQVSTYPHGLVSQSLSQLVQQIANNTSNIPQITQQISLQKFSVKDVSQAIVNAAVQISNGGLSNINQQISQTAQLIAKQTGVSPDKVQSIIKQLSIQTAKVGGSDLTSKTVQQIISQINKNPNPNVALIQAIGMLAKSDDMGKTGKLLNFVKEIVKSSRDGISTGSSGGGGTGGNKGDDGKKVVDRIIKTPAPSKITPAARTPGAPGTTAIGGTKTLPGIPNSVAFPPGSQLVDFDFLRGLVFVRLGLPGGPVVPFPSNADIRFGPNSKPIGVVCSNEFPCGQAIPQSAPTGVSVPQSAPTGVSVPQSAPTGVSVPQSAPTGVQFGKSDAGTSTPTKSGQAGPGTTTTAGPAATPSGPGTTTTTTPGRTAPDDTQKPRPPQDFVCSPPITCENPPIPGSADWADTILEFLKKSAIKSGINTVTGIPGLGGVLYPSPISPEQCSLDPRHQIHSPSSGCPIYPPIEKITKPSQELTCDSPEVANHFAVNFLCDGPVPLRDFVPPKPIPDFIPTPTETTTAPEAPAPDDTQKPRPLPSPPLQNFIPTPTETTTAPANTPASSGKLGGLGAGITGGEASTAPPTTDSTITEPTEPTGQTIPPLDATISSLATDPTTPTETKGEVVEPTKPTTSISDTTSSLQADSTTTPTEVQGEEVVEEPIMPTVESSTIDPDTEASTDPTTPDESDMDATEIESEESGESEEVTVEEEICDNGEDDEEDSDCEGGVKTGDGDNDNDNDNELDPVDDPNVDVDEYIASIDYEEEEDEEDSSDELAYYEEDDEEEEDSSDELADDDEEEEEDDSYDEGY